MFRIDKARIDHNDEPFILFSPPVIDIDEDVPEEDEIADSGPPLPDPEELLNEARIECDEIIKAAQDQAQTILQYAEDSAQLLKEKSQAEGYNKGMEAASRELERLRAEQTLAFETLRAKIAAQQGRLVDELKTQALELSVVIAEKIINTALTDTDAFMAFVEGALSHVKAEREVTLRVNAVEYAMYFMNEMPRADDEMKVTVVPDESLPPGGCIVETNSEMVNASVDRQLGAIRTALTQAPVMP